MPLGIENSYSLTSVVCDSKLCPTSVMSLMMVVLMNFQNIKSGGSGSGLAHTIDFYSLTSVVCDSKLCPTSVMSLTMMVLMNFQNIKSGGGGSGLAHTIDFPVPVPPITLW